MRPLVARRGGPEGIVIRAGAPLLVGLRDMAHEPRDEPASPGFFQHQDTATEDTQVTL